MHTTLMLRLCSSRSYSLNVPEHMERAFGCNTMSFCLRKCDHINKGSKAKGVGSLQLMYIDFLLNLQFTVCTYVQHSNQQSLVLAIKRLMWPDPEVFL